MNNRSGLGLLLIAWLSLGYQPASAQTLRFKESHHALPDEPDMVGPEMMADRLKELHELHQLQDRVQDLLKDPDFQKNLTTNFSREELQQLQEKILKGDGLKQDPLWNKLLDQAVSGHKRKEGEVDILRRLAERLDNQRSSVPIESASLAGRPPPADSSTSSPGTGSSGSGAFPPAEPSFWDRLQGETRDWIKEHMDDLAGDVFEAVGELGATEEGAPLAELLRSLDRSDFSGGGLAEEAAGLSSYLPDLGEFVPEPNGPWDELSSIFREARAPSLPGVGGGPSLPAAPSADGEGWGGGMLALLAVGVLLLLWWKMGGWSRWKASRDEIGAWRLGPWPVSPSAVSTRRDLVRAFEHLALLCLGPDASTCHHRELADRLAAQDSGAPARRQAADQLGWLYEQARYAPADEWLSQDELVEARHALCFLAGVTAV